MRLLLVLIGLVGLVAYCALRVAVAVVVLLVKLFIAAVLLACWVVRTIRRGIATT